MVVALLLAGNFVASIPAYYTTLHTVCSLPPAQCTSWQPLPANMVALARLHIPVEAYAAYFVSLDAAASLLFWVVGLLIFWRKSREWMGLFFSLVLIMYGSSGISTTLSGAFLTSDSPLILGLPLTLFSFLQWPAFGTFLVVFPTGQFAPRWSWVIILLWVVQVGFFLLSTMIPVLGNFLLLVVLATYGSTLSVQVYRYVKVYDAVQRQQVKWFIFAFSLGLTLVTLGNGLLGQLVVPLNAPDSWYQLLNGTITVLLFVPIPLSIGVAIFRYHLWDIDIIINRALVYGSLTLTLALVYIGLVFGSQALLIGLIGNNDGIVIVASTLIVVALFQPLRRWIQATIDRRFYRSKYNATRTLAAFGGTLRSEVDLHTLSERLVAVVQETMQPAHASLWLCKSVRKENKSALPEHE
jgi:hypothetical protein